MKIVKWYNSDVVYESKKETIKEAVIEAVGIDANLRGANLQNADLQNADLRDADLYHAHFYGRGGTTKIKRSQIEQFHEALGIVVVEE